MPASADCSVSAIVKMTNSQAMITRCMRVVAGVALTIPSQRNVVASTRRTRPMSAASHLPRPKRAVDLAAAWHALGNEWAQWWAQRRGGCARAPSPSPATTRIARSPRAARARRALRRDHARVPGEARGALAGGGTRRRGSRSRSRSDCLRTIAGFARRRGASRRSFAGAAGVSAACGVPERARRQCARCPTRNASACSS